MTTAKRRLLVLYATETGTAEEVAERIAREARNRHFDVELSAFDAYERGGLVDEKCAVFVCSTTGQGEEPRMMTDFWRFLLRKSWPKDILSGLSFGVFGLGDSSYAKFNFPAKKLFKRLVQLGAEPLVERGDGDDQHYLGLDGGLDPWLNGLWEVLSKKFPLPPGLTPISDASLPPPSFKIAFVVEPSTVMLDERRDKESSNLLRGRVLKNLRLTQESHFQDIRHLEIEITKPETLSLSDTKITYNSGDALALRPHNTASRVNDFLELMNWQEVADRPLNIEPTRTDTKIPSHLSTYSASQLTLRTLLTHHLDIHGRPRRYFFQLLSFFATSEQHTERLIELASTEGQDDLYKYCHLLKRTVFEVLQDFPCRIPLSYLFDLFPGMRPRSFSIASSNSLHPFQIHLTVGIVEFKTKMQAPRLGVCTHWMRQWQAGHEIEFWFTKGTMTLPKSPGIPVLLIGPGTGVAPMRSFVQERFQQGEKENYLFFGCRYKLKDFLYEKEWDDLVSRGALHLFTAFSRDQEDTKIYVQDLIRKEGQLVWNLLESRGAHIYISGNSKVPEGVCIALKAIFEEIGGLTENEAETYFTGLEKSRRLQTETWS